MLVDLREGLGEVRGVLDLVLGRRGHKADAKRLPILAGTLGARLALRFGFGLVRTSGLLVVAQMFVELS